jgi:hypothetical protein
VFPLGSAGGFTGHELVERCQHVLDHFRRQSRINADEESVRRDQIAVRQRTCDAMFNLRVGRVAEQVSAEKVPRFDARRLQRVDQLGSREGCLGPHARTGKPRLLSGPG